MLTNGHGSQRSRVLVDGDERFTVMEVERSVWPVITPLGLRFFAAGLPEGEAPSRLRAGR